MYLEKNMVVQQRANFSFDITSNTIKNNLHETTFRNVHSGEKVAKLETTDQLKLKLDKLLKENDQLKS